MKKVVCKIREEFFRYISFCRSCRYFKKRHIHYNYARHGNGKVCRLIASAVCACSRICLYKQNAAAGRNAGSNGYCIYKLAHVGGGAHAVVCNIHARHAGQAHAHVASPPHGILHATPRDNGCYRVHMSGRRILAGRIACSNNSVPGGQPSVRRRGAYRICRI